MGRSLRIIAGRLLGRDVDVQLFPWEQLRRQAEPHFADYLYLSFNDATAFSPTDVLPLSRWAKLSMMVQSAVALVVVALVVVRAVNVLG